MNSSKNNRCLLSLTASSNFCFLITTVLVRVFQRSRSSVCVCVCVCVERERERRIYFKELGHAIMEAPSPKSAE